MKSRFWVPEPAGWNCFVSVLLLMHGSLEPPSRGTPHHTGDCRARSHALRPGCSLPRADKEQRQAGATAGVRKHKGAPSLAAGLPNAQRPVDTLRLTLVATLALPAPTALVPASERTSCFSKARLLRHHSLSPERGPWHQDLTAPTVPRTLLIPEPASRGIRD